MGKFFFRQQVLCIIYFYVVRFRLPWFAFVKIKCSVSPRLNTKKTWKHWMPQFHKKCSSLEPLRELTGPCYIQIFVHDPNMWTREDQSQQFTWVGLNTWQGKQIGNFNPAIRYNEKKVIKCLRAVIVECFCFVFFFQCNVWVGCYCV